MSEDIQEFLDWLEEQGYWVNSTVVKEKYPDLDFRDSQGITVKKNDDGDVMIPKRDYRGLLIRTEGDEQ